MADVKGSATTADLHLREYIWAARPSLKGDTIIAMQYFFKYCIENRLSAKLAGDIFHTLAVLPEHVAPLWEGLSLMQEAELPVYYIQGNHDANKVPWLALHPWPTHVHNKILELTEAGEVLLGHDATNEDELREWLKTTDSNVDTLMLHQAEKTAMPFSPNFDLDDVPGHIKTVLIGDIHTAQSYTNANGTTLYYPGSPAISEIGHINPRSFVLEQPTPEGTGISTVVIPGRTVLRFDITSEADVAKVEEAVKVVAEIDKRHFDLNPLIRIVYKPDLSDICYQTFHPMRETHSVYTWLDVLSAEIEAVEGGDENTQMDTSSGVMERVIAERVQDGEIRALLDKVYREGNVSEVLTPELEKIV